MRRRHAHRGAVPAVGVVIEPARIGEAEARRRVLAWWTPGCELRAVGELWILRLAAPRRVAVLAAPGAPLIEAHGVLAALPVTAAEVATLGAPTGAAVVARGGALVALGAGEVVDPASWLAVDSFAILTASPLAAPPPPPVAVEIARDLRAVLGVAPAVAETSALRAALLGETPPGEGAGTGTGAGEGEGAAAPSGTRTKGPWWARAVSGVLGSGRRSGSGTGSGPGRGSGSGDGSGDGTGDGDEAAVGEPRPPGFFDRLRDRAARAIYESRLGKLVGQRHADYLRETLEMFDRGELDEALRRAIPLGGDGDGSERPAIGLPAPRTELRPSLAPPGGPASAIHVAQQAMRLLRDRYEVARDRLIRDGRIEEAAFVVADLLGDPEAAVALLERHDRLRLAAELAEARALPPGLVVRQWFLAGEPDRAIAVAWRTGAFADALARAHRTSPELAERLRLRWAHALAAAGDFLGAVEIARGLADPTAAPTDAWIDHGIAGGGVAAARLWIRRLERAPARLPEVRAAVLEVLDGDRDEALPERIAVAQALSATSAGEPGAALARAAVRTMLAEIGRGVDGEPAVLLPRLVRIAGDATLRADLPALGPQPGRRALVDRQEPWQRRIARSDAGAVAVRDLVLLPSGRLLVALGESGVRLLGRDGQRIARFDQPADALVINDHGTRAIAVARRGGVRRLAHLDLVQRTAASWCEVALDGWADTFDGATWLVTRGRDLLALDVAAASPRAGWGTSVGEGGHWRGLTRDGDRWAALSVDDGEVDERSESGGVGTPGAVPLGRGRSPRGIEAWSYERLTLRRRAPLPPEPGDRLALALAVIADTGAWLSVSAAYSRATRTVSEPTLVTADWRERLGDDRHVRELHAMGRFVAITAEAPGRGVVVEARYLPTRRVVATLALEGAQAAAVRLADLCLVVGDDRGRVLVVDLRNGGVRRDLRLV